MPGTVDPTPRRRSKSCPHPAINKLVAQSLLVFTTPSLHDLLSFRQPREPIGVQPFYPKRSHDTAGSFAQNAGVVSAESMSDSESPNADANRKIK